MGRLESIQELGEISQHAQVPVSYQGGQSPPPQPEETVALMEAIEAGGGKVFGQLDAEDDFSFIRLGETNLSLMGNRGWGSAMKINPRAARVANFADAEQQGVLIQNLENGGAQHIGSFVVTETHHADNEQYLGRTLQSIADEQGVEVGRVLIELSLRDDLETEFTKTNPIATETKRKIAEMVTGHESLFQIGASDAGAHVTQKCGTGQTSDLLANFVREGHLTLEEAVYQMTGKNAEQWGMVNRGTLRPGNHADLVLFDLDKVQAEQSSYVRDMPGEQSRYYRGASGFAAVWVNGALVLRDGAYVEEGFGNGAVV